MSLFHFSLMITSFVKIRHNTSKMYLPPEIKAMCMGHVQQINRRRDFEINKKRLGKSLCFVEFLKPCRGAGYSSNGLNWEYSTVYVAGTKKVIWFFEKNAFVHTNCIKMLRQSLHLYESAVKSDGFDVWERIGLAETIGYQCTQRWNNDFTDSSISVEELKWRKSQCILKLCGVSETM